MTGTMRITAMVVFILIGSRVFSLVFQGVDGGIWIEHLLSNLPGGQTGFLIVVNVFIFFLAFFLDFFEIAFIILPLLGPVAEKMGIDLILHPPFGFALFYLRGISDSLFKGGVLPRKVESRDIYLGAIPFVILQLVLVVVVIFVPQTVTVFLDEKVVFDLDKVEMPAVVDDLGEAAAEEADTENRLRDMAPPAEPEPEPAK